MKTMEDRALILLKDRALSLEYLSKALRCDYYSAQSCMYRLKRKGLATNQDGKWRQGTAEERPHEPFLLADCWRWQP